MARVITFSRFFPIYHPKAGEPTYFVEKILNSLGVTIQQVAKEKPYNNAAHIINDFFVMDGSDTKHHTIRSGNRWKVGDTFSPRVWKGKPYNSPQIQFAPDIEIKKVWNFDIYFEPYHKVVFKINHKQQNIKQMEILAKNDGLEYIDLLDWFKVHPKLKAFHFEGQIICWSDTVNY